MVAEPGSSGSSRRKRNLADGFEQLEQPGGDGREDKTTELKLEELYRITDEGGAFTNRTFAFMGSEIDKDLDDLY